MNGLDAASRDALERAIVKASQLLEDDLADTAAGRFGIYADGTHDPKDALRLSPSELRERHEVVDIVDHLCREGENARGAVRRLVREAAFTHLNRLVAIRVAEAIGLLPPSLAQARASQGFRDLLEVAPSLAADATGGYWTYLRLCGDELAADDPVLFDPRNPLLALAPSPAALDHLAKVLGDPKLAAAWAAPDTLGWAYQFFNTGEERRQMREESPAPRTSRELAVRNQFFTPRYVVDFLVQNSLGRRLVEADPDSGLADELPLLVDPSGARGQPLALDEVRVLDPACGSGHFLLGCYDLLELAWRRAGVKPAEAAARILPCLWGIDIDPRCAQVASAVLMLRARRACREGDLPRPNVLSARALPEDPDAWERALAGLSSNHGKILTGLRDALAQAPVLGPLLKVEERLAAEVHSAVPEAGGEDTLFGASGMAAAAIGRAEAEVLAAVQRVADEASSTAAERLLAAEATDAIRFVEAMRQRYDAVLMNPPFGEPVADTKPYLRTAYPWMSSDGNLFAVFVGRGLELLSEGGYVGAITSRVGMFLTTFERWRREILLAHRLPVLADLGHGVMEQAVVEAAAYVVGADSVDSGHSTFIRLLRDADRASALVEALRTNVGSRIFRLSQHVFSDIPGAPIAYWVDDAVRKLFRSYPSLEGNGAEVRVGGYSGDNFRRIRLAWEVLPSRIGRTLLWVPYAKGGEYSPYYADTHLLIAWDDSRRTYRDFYGRRGRPSHQPENVDYYFRPGLTWPTRTASGFGVRVLPEGCIFGHKGPAAFASNEDHLLLLGWLTTRLTRACVDTMVAAGEEVTSGGASRSYEVGLVQRLPWPGSALDDRTRQEVTRLVRDIAVSRAQLDEAAETSRRFVSPQVLRESAMGLRNRIADAVNSRFDIFSAILQTSLALEHLFHESIGVDAATRNYLDREIGSHPASYNRDSVRDEAELYRLFALPIDALIDSVIAERGGLRAIANLNFIADRRVEVLAHALECHPTAIDECRRRLDLLPPEELTRSAEELVSYLVGVAFGRWDARIARDLSLAPPQTGLFDPVPLCPPGMLVGNDGLPARKAPQGYPFELPPDWLLLDEPGHEWDIEAAVGQAAAELLDDPESILAEVEGILGYRSLRDYLRKQFFKDHLGRYTKSRRKAPIYWYLSVLSREWGVWVYAPTLSRETLYAVASHAARRQAAGRERVEALRAERDAGGRGRSAREVLKHLEGEEDLVKELEVFRAEAERIARLGWEPDLDDGIILCAAPLATLFPAWRLAAEERAKLRNGVYPWASVSRWGKRL